jgi:DtxR family transcriptional regulator, Mn-dependent transcriptional regulator
MSTVSHMQHEHVGVNDATLHYLDVIYRLTLEKPAANTTDIAKRAGVTASGASVMLKRLKERKLVQVTPYKGATLTPQGKKLALRTIRRHRLLEMFLVQVMGFQWHEVDPLAHAMETTIDDAFEDRMSEMLGHPTRCPHGHLIPAKDGTLPVANDVPLLELQPGVHGVIRCVDTDNGDWLKYIGDQGLRPGEAITLKDIAPYGGPVTLESTRGVHTLGRNLASLVYIEVA